MKSFVACLAFAVLVVVPLVAGQVAVATLYGTGNDPAVEGTVTFTKLNETFTKVDIHIHGITVNADLEHGIHVHQFGDVLTDRGNATAVGSHWVGNGSSTHGCPGTGGPRHAGDLGKFQATAGEIIASIEVDLLTWTNDALVGHAVVLHAKADDCTYTNSSGSRLATGVIGYTNVTGAAYTVSTTKLATCFLRHTDAVSNNLAEGEVWFKEEADMVTIWGIFSNLVAGSVHGLHIHAWGDVSHRNGTSVGAHWDPFAVGKHGIPPSAERHAGDLGNIMTYDGAKAYYSYSIPTSYFTVSGIIGRGLILHAMQDDGCLVTSSGVRVAQCTIGIADASWVPVWPVATVNVPAQVGSNCNPVAPTAPVAPVAATPKTSSAASIVATLALVFAFALIALVF